MATQAADVDAVHDQALARIDQAIRDALDAGLLDAQTVERLTEAFAETVAGLGAVGAMPAAGTGLSEAEVEALRSAEIDPEDPELEGDAGAAFAGGVADYARLTGTALTTAEAAERAGVSPGRVRQLVSKGQLLAVKVSGDLRIPRFQFADEGGLLPGLARVIGALDLGLLHPVAVERWFVLPREELGGMPVRTWLLSGHTAEEPERLARRAASIP
ncbi:MAG TPA: helix-turn-helix domain-containing protein [Candidatus Dormibacteraeota bacterium]|nr:helix-turn-helix domain-containing protein [Candidatus Dormibacteraeota bacterium]